MIRLPDRPRLPLLVALVAVGGALGGLARWALGEGVAPVGGLPLATLLANLLGCLALGLLVGRVGSSPVPRALLGTGLLGGFTTFSTLALETDRLLAAAPGTALAHLALNTAGGLALARVGLRLGARTTP